MVSDEAKRAAEKIDPLYDDPETMSFDREPTLRLIEQVIDAEFAPLRSERDALAAKVAELKRLLRPFAHYANAIDKYENYESHVPIGYIQGGPSVGDCRAARSALQETSRDA